MTDMDLDRLADAVRSRRVALNLRQIDFPISPAKLVQIEKGAEPPPSPLVSARLESALGWAPGSIRAILGGGNPTMAGDLANVDFWAFLGSGGVVRHGLRWPDAASIHQNV
jgi:hypothetical protein